MESARSSRSSRSPSPADERHIIDGWQPEALVPELEAGQHEHLLEPRVVSSKPGKLLRVNGRECLNVATHNYLGLAESARLERACVAAARKYGVGSCGPRAFYGTMDVHLELEARLADFLQVQEVALYAFGFATIASAIPAYAKASDVIFLDELCNFAIQRGVAASKARAIKFSHNSSDDLAAKLAQWQAERAGPPPPPQQQQQQQQRRRQQQHQRAFLIVEAVYAQTGAMCPLVQLVRLAKRHKLRLFVDESRSFGVLGATGRGITEHLGVQLQDVDLIMASLEGALCGYGGFCAGSKYIVDHQRLAGTGYIFSASLPPFQCRAALEALNMLVEQPKLIEQAQERFQYAHEALEQLSGLKNLSHPLSPVKILVPKRSDGTYSIRCNYNKQHERMLAEACNKLLLHDHIALTVSRYLIDDEMTSPLASLKLIISAALTHADIDRLVLALERVLPVQS